MISVIVPVYNAEKYLRRCLESIVQQSYKDFEVIIVNDGSIDASEKICTEFASRNEQIRIITIANNGVSNARNIGLDAALGDYISFVDADDYLDENYLENYIKLAVSTKADIVIGGIQEENGDRINYLSNKNMVLKKNRIKKLVYSLLDNKSDEENTYSPQVLGFSYCKLYNKNIVKKIKFNQNIPIREDTIFNVEAFLASDKIALGDFIGYHYVINKTSATGRFRKNFTIEAKCFLNACKKLWEHNRLRKDSYYICCLYTYMRWIKYFALHKDSGFTKKQQLSIIKASFDDKIWQDAFLHVQSELLNIKYKILRLLFKYRWAAGIRRISKLSEMKR